MVGRTNMKTDVYFAKKDDFGLIAYENDIRQNVFMQVAAIDYAPQVNEIIICDAKCNIKEFIEKFSTTVDSSPDNNLPSVQNNISFTVIFAII